MKDRISTFLATGCYIGLIPGAPGTYASLVTTVVYYLIYRISFRIIPDLHLSSICLITAVGIVTSARTSRALGDEDPKVVVIDEIAGQLTALLFLPVRSYNLIAGTVLFRLFDIWKPYPIRKLEPLKNGVGIMADDLLAGIYANVALEVANMFVRG